MINAGFAWQDSPVVVDQGSITSKDPGDLDAFSTKIIEEMAEGRHSQRSAAELQAPKRAGGIQIDLPTAAISAFSLKDQLLELCKFDIAATQQYYFSYARTSLFCGQITGASRLRKKEPRYVCQPCPSHP